MTKPFDTEELLLRIKAILRRSQNHQPQKNGRRWVDFWIMMSFPFPDSTTKQTLPQKRISTFVPFVIALWQNIHPAATDG